MENQVLCPKCGSSSITANKRGYNVAKGVGGLLIPGGVLWGLHGKNKITITCLNCGNKWSPGDTQTTSKPVEQPSKSYSQTDYTKQKTGMDKTADDVKSFFIGILVFGGIIAIIAFCMTRC